MLSHGTKHVTGKVKENYAKQVDDAKGGKEKSKGKEKLSNFKNINWIISPAEKIPVSNNLFDFYTISFGLRNTAKIDKALSEAYRVLKPGGRFLCLEFSKIQNTNLETLYKNYSKLIPSICLLYTSPSPRD